MKGMLAPKYREVVLGHAEVRQTYKVSSVGTVAGCYVQDGKIVRSCSESSRFLVSFPGCYSKSSIIFFTSTGCRRPYTVSPIITCLLYTSIQWSASQ